MRANSFRHHYIPQFLINGFTDKEGFVYIYDKVKDKILDNKRSPKSIFFETNRNTIENSNLESTSLIEDEFYMKLDDDSSKLIQKLQRERITDNLLNIESRGGLQFFLINLFWRLPLTDYTVSDLIYRARINSDGIDIEKLRLDKNLHKIKRTGLFIDTINKLKENKPDIKDSYVKLSEFDRDTFILGDYPILFESTPSKFTDLGYMDYLFALSSRRIYSSTKAQFGAFTYKDALSYNFLIILQSEKYVCSGNLNLLQNTVEYYRKFKKIGLLYIMKERLFSRRNNLEE